MSTLSDGVCDVSDRNFVGARVCGIRCGSFTRRWSLSCLSPKKQTEDVQTALGPRQFFPSSTRI
jgi:hypothetical protein